MLKEAAKKLGKKKKVRNMHDASAEAIYTSIFCL